MVKKSLFFSGWVGILSLIFLIHEGWAGVVIEELHRDMEGRTGKVIRYYSEDQFRTDHLEAGISTIIDFRGDRIVMIDHQSKGYVDIKFSQWEKEVAEKLRKSMPGIKPKERRIVVRGTGVKALINGFQTEKVEVLADGELIEENWMTRDVDVRDIEKIMEKVAKGFSKSFKLEMKEGKEIYERLKPHGVPILIKDYALTHGLGPINVLEVKRVEKKELGSEIFRAPLDYQRIMPEGLKK